MRVEVVSIGDELLLAKILDTNATYLTRALRELGVALTARVIVGDEPAAIASALNTGLARADVVICSGGLGIHSDDFTRHAVAEVTGQALTRERPGVSGGRALGNSTLTPGLMFELAQGTLICLPGNQREMAYLLQSEVLPYLQERLPDEAATGSTVIRTAGIMESSVREQLSGLQLQPGEQITYTSYAGQTDIRVQIRAETAATVEAGLERLAEAIETRLGDHVYGRNEERLEGQLLLKLRQHGLRAALAEYGTGGSTAQMAKSVPRAGEAFIFIPVMTPEGTDQFLALASLRAEGDLTQWCKQVAEQLRAKSGAQLGLVIYKNVTPGGVQLLITLDTPSGVSVTQRSFGGHPGNVDHWAATLGLVKLRYWLLAHYPDQE